MKPEFRLKVAEWELRKALAGPSANKVQVADIQKLMPDEFNRKLKEWELMKISSPGNERCGQIFKSYDSPCGFRRSLRSFPRQFSASSSSTAIPPIGGGVGGGGMVVKKKKARDHKRRSSNNGGGGYGKSADKWVSPVITHML